MRQVILVAHNIRSCHNVGSILRTAEGLGVDEVVLSGYTPYPRWQGDERLPHIAARVSSRISQTALGAEQSVRWSYWPAIADALAALRAKQFRLVALEQTSAALPLPKYRPPDKIALIVGHETDGLESSVLATCDEVVMIPMFGRKESFNVAVAAGIALYHSRFHA